MRKFRKIVMMMGVLSLLSVMPLAAQVIGGDATGVYFATPFPFYAGNVKLPAGSYVITQPNINEPIVLIRASAQVKGEFIYFIPTSSLHPQMETDVTFQKYGDTGYLQTLSIQGQTTGIEFRQTKAEAKANNLATNTNESSTVVEQAMLGSGK